MSHTWHIKHRQTLNAILDHERQAKPWNTNEQDVHVYMPDPCQSCWQPLSHVFNVWIFKTDFHRLLSKIPITCVYNIEMTYTLNIEYKPKRVISN